jgi:CHAT domain-containing protein
MPRTHPSPCVPAGRSGRTAVLAALLAALLAAASGCGTALGDEAPEGLLAELARQIQSAPAIAPRLSISGPRPPCISPETLASERPRTPCAAAGAGARSARIARISARAAQRIRQTSDVEAMRAAALIDLLFESGGGKSLGRAISSLQTAARLSERPAPVLADLAAAYIVRAEREHAPRDLLAAVEAAEEALERDPGNQVARYNLALALERFGLLEEAAAGWSEYAAGDSLSPWATAARGHLRTLLGARAAPAPPGRNADETVFAAFAAVDPQEAAELGWCNVLPRWAAAIQAGEPASAERELRRAEALGRALASRPGGDRGLDDAVRAIRTQARPRELRTLARAHHEFGAGCRLHDQAELRSAATHFSAAAAHAGQSPVLGSWARLLYGSMVFHRGDRRGGERIMREEAARTDTARYPALAGRTRLLLSALLLRTDRYDAALEQADRAVPLFARAGEGENEGAALDAMSVAQFGRREMDEGYALAQRALWRLRPYRSSYRLHNLLTVTSQIVGDDGLPRAAIRMQDEGVRVANRIGSPAFVAEAHLGRARLRARMGDARGAGTDAETGHLAAAGITDPRVRGWITAQWRMVAAATSLRAEPARAGEALDSAAAYYLGIRAPFIALRAVVGAAEAGLAAGNTEAARARLETALGMLEHRRDSIRMESRRAAVFETARGVVDHITTLELASGRTAGALAYLDRGRASLAPVGGVHAAEDGRAVAGPPGEVVLVFAMVGDTLLAWTVEGRQVQLFRTTLDTLRLARTVESLRRQLEGSADERELLPALTGLYDLLLRPVAGRLGAPGTPLVIVADGAVASVPFAALYDARRRRYLTEDHALRFAPSLQEARRPPRRPGAGELALFVADPAFDPERHPGFERLAGAAAEVRDMAAVYGGRQVLSGGAASAEALRAAMGSAAVVHYAGHAVFDDERPERSYLLLAPSRDGAATGTLDAREIAELDLRHLSVVVLAACQTVRTGPGRAAGFSGLAGAFLTAGAGGALGSLWEVNDLRTRPLMVAFHQAYRATGNGPQALRAAQLALLRSRDEALRSPATWAAFRYVGS